MSIAKLSRTPGAAGGYNIFPPSTFTHQNPKAQFKRTFKLRRGQKSGAGGWFCVGRSHTRTRSLEKLRFLRTRLRAVHARCTEVGIARRRFC
jgi:hypothetical protein